MVRTLLCSLAFLLAPLSSPAAPEDPLKDARRVVFLGDSITAGGHYIVLLDAALRATHPDAEFINLGLPSEGVTGLSEPKHPFPRPNLHERLDRALAKAKPDVVFACYGMNDGIYYPFSEERFAKYQAGINTLIEKVSKQGARLILLSPPPFDPLPFRKKGKLLPVDAPEFSWTGIYEDYDRAVIARYARWVLAQKERTTACLDLHGPITASVAKRRETDPDFALSGDGVHLDNEGHRLIADTIHRGLYAQPLPEIPEATLELVAAQHKILVPAWLTHVGHKRPGGKPGLPLPEARTKAAALAAAE